MFTPNDQFFVRWHWAFIPNSVDVDSFELKIHGHVNQPLTLSLKELVKDFPRVKHGRLRPPTSNFCNLAFRDWRGFSAKGSQSYGRHGWRGGSALLHIARTFS